MIKGLLRMVNTVETKDDIAMVASALGISKIRVMYEAGLIDFANLKEQFRSFDELYELFVELSLFVSGEERKIIFDLLILGIASEEQYMRVYNNISIMLPNDIEALLVCGYKIAKTCTFAQKLNVIIQGQYHVQERFPNDMLDKMILLSDSKEFLFKSLMAINEPKEIFFQTSKVKINDDKFDLIGYYDVNPRYAGLKSCNDKILQKIASIMANDGRSDASIRQYLLIKFCTLLGDDMMMNLAKIYISEYTKTIEDLLFLNSNRKRRDGLGCVPQQKINEICIPLILNSDYQMAFEEAKLIYELVKVDNDDIDISRVAMKKMFELQQQQK